MCDEELEQQIALWSRDREGCKRLQQIPRVGPITASAIVASIGDAKLFRNARQLAAWLEGAGHPDTAGCAPQSPPDPGLLGIGRSKFYELPVGHHRAPDQDRAAQPVAPIRYSALDRVVGAPKFDPPEAVISVGSPVTHDVLCALLQELTGGVTACFRRKLMLVGHIPFPRNDDAHIRRTKKNKEEQTVQVHASTRFVRHRTDSSVTSH